MVTVKKTYLILSLFLILIINIVNAAIINTFSDDTTAGNFSYNSSGSIYKNISLPNNGYINSGSLELTGNQYCTNCGITYNNSINIFDYPEAVNNGNNFYDNDWGTSSWSSAEYTYGRTWYVNFTVPSFVSNNSNFTYNMHSSGKTSYSLGKCWDDSVIQIKVRSLYPHYTVNRGHGNLSCWNGSQWQYIYEAGSEVSPLGCLWTSSCHKLYELGMDWDKPYSIENLTVKLNDNEIYQNLSTFNGTTTIDLNTTLLRSCVSACSNPSGSDCSCELNFTSGTFGILGYSDLSINYTAYPMDDCSSYTTKILTFVGKNEEDNQDVNMTLDLTLFSDVLDYNDTLDDLSFEFRNGYNYSICVAINETYYIDSIMDYGDGVTYTKRKYYLNDYEANSTEQFVYLYHLNNSKASEIIFSVYDTQTGKDVPNTYIKILRYYPGENLYRTVEVAKTDETGQSIGKMVLADVFYKFLVEVPAGTIKLNTDVLRVLSLTRSFGITLATDYLDTFRRIGSVSISTTCTKGTQVCRVTWSDASNIVQDVKFEVWRSTGLSDTLLYSQTTTASSGTMAYTITEDTTGYTYIAKSFIESNTGTSWYSGGVASMFYSENVFFTDEDDRLASLFPLFLLLIVIVFALVDFGVIGITIGSLLGLIVASIIGILPLSPFYFVSIIALATILIYKLSK